MERTKGNWYSSYHGERDGFERYSVNTDTHLICSLGVRTTSDETSANAQLIAAAPDMYEALKALHKVFFEDFNTAYTPKQNKALFDALEALAKAEGKQ